MKWRYQIIDQVLPSKQAIEDYLNSLGEEGWECIDVHWRLSDDQYACRFIMKVPKEGER